MENRAFSDEDLARMATEGDVKAFEELFQRYKKPVLNFIYRILGNKETAEEITQEVFMKVYVNLDTFDPTRKFSPWLYTIARNLSKNAMRDKKYFRNMSLEEAIQDGEEPVRLKDVLSDPSPRPDSIAQDNELAEEAQQVLDSMPLKYKEVIIMCSIQGMSLKEAAEILCCSIASVSIRLDKAKKMFMEKLGISQAGTEGSKTGSDEDENAYN